jgi:hypothetical protein
MQKLGEGHGAAGSGGGLPWGEWVGLRDIYEAYATWAAKQKDIWKPQGIVIFGREMDRVMGGPHGLPKRNQGQGIGWQKRLPGLDEMRATMERRLGGGGIDWGTGSDEAGEGETLLG